MRMLSCRRPGSCVSRFAFKRVFRPGSRHILKPAICLVGAIALAGCSDNDESASGGSDSGGGDVTNRSSLRTIADREAFMGELRTSLSGQYASGGLAGGFIDAVAEGAGTDGGAASDSASSAQPSATAGGGGSESLAAGDVSTTNVQEVGVDEQDRVKTDGERIYVLDTRFSNTVDPVPVPEPLSVTEFDPEQGGGIDQSSVPAPNARSTLLRVLDMDREAPDALPIADINVDLGGRSADGFYLSGSADSRAAIVVAGGFGGYAYWGDSWSFGGVDTLVARVPLTDPASASVDASLRIDGQTVSSRRIDDRLFIATRFYPRIDGIDPWNVDQATWEAAIAAATDGELLPAWTDTNGNSTPLIDPASCFVAERSANASYYGADIITLSVIDLNNMQPIDSECFLGRSETLYASPEAVFLATTRWDYNYGPVTTDGDVVDPDDIFVSSNQVISDPRVDTDIHRFDITESGLSYSASGSINGHLGWNPERMPYRLSDYNGDLRIASMPAVFNAEASPIVLTVLRDDGAGTLETVAELPNDARPEPIGKPYEQLYASRFVGDRAYLVTFRQTDPLYVVDLSRPADPELLGELEITGYSDWLLPIGSDHLLGLGKDAVPVQDGLGDGRGGLQQGVKLSLFDVSDPRSPVEVSSQRIGERGTEAVALYNPRAITIQPANNTHPTRVALGIDVHGTAVSPPLESISEPWSWHPWSYTGLHGFDILTGADARIEARGALVVETATAANQYGPQEGNDRSVLAGDAAFYVHGDRVHAAHWDTLSNSSAAR